MGSWNRSMCKVSVKQFPHFKNPVGQGVLIKKQNINTKHNRCCMLKPDTYRLKTFWLLRLRTIWLLRMSWNVINVHLRLFCWHANTGKSTHNRKYNWGLSEYLYFSLLYCMSQFKTLTEWEREEEEEEPQKKKTTTEQHLPAIVVISLLKRS